MPPPTRSTGRRPAPMRGPGAARGGTEVGVGVDVANAETLSANNRSIANNGFMIPSQWRFVLITSGSTGRHYHIRSRAPLLHRCYRARLSLFGARRNFQSASQAPSFPAEEAMNCDHLPRTRSPRSDRPYAGE